MRLIHIQVLYTLSERGHYMFLTEVRVGCGVLLECTILKSAPNILAPSCMLIGWEKMENL